MPLRVVGAELGRTGTMSLKNALAKMLGGRCDGWRPGDCWGPLARALDRPEPSEPFPHASSTEQFPERVAAAEAFGAAGGREPGSGGAP